jgi:hypothetical protein
MAILATFALLAAAFPGCIVASLHLLAKTYTVAPVKIVRKIANKV